MLFARKTSNPTRPPMGRVKLYPDANGDFQVMDDAGSVTPLVSGGGSAPSTAYAELVSAGHVTPDDGFGTGFINKQLYDKVSPVTTTITRQSAGVYEIATQQTWGPDDMIIVKVFPVEDFRYGTSFWVVGGQASALTLGTIELVFGTVDHSSDIVSLIDPAMVSFIYECYVITDGLL